MKKLLIVVTLALCLLPLHAQQPMGGVTSGGGGGGGCAATGPNGTACLDNFQRADTGPPPSANWTTPMVVADSGLKVVSNQCQASADPSGGYWNATTFGPQSEAWAVYGGTGNFQVYARVTSPGASGETGYLVYADVGASKLHIYRMDSSSSFTEIAASVAQAVSTGDAVGITCSGNQISAWYKASGGSWSNVRTTTDGTYSSAGNIGLRLLGNAAATVNNFGGGTY